MTRRPLTIFFVLVFIITWAVWLPRAVTPDGLAGALGQVWTYGPALAAVFAAALTGGLGDLGRRLIRWRVGPMWYAIALLGPAAASILIAGLNTLLGGEWALAWGSPADLLPLLLVLALTDGLGEEAGWRGFALPRMLTRTTPLTASLILGLIWAVWHLPLFWTETSPLYGQSIPMLFVELPAQAVIYTWLFQHTRGSALLAILMHAAGNTFAFRADDLRLAVIESAVLWTLAFTIVLVNGPTLSRTPVSEEKSHLED